MCQCSLTFWSVLCWVRADTQISWALSLHSVMPRWPSCRLSSMSALSDGRITSLLPKSKRPFWTVSSLWNGRYGWSTHPTEKLYGHPSAQYCFSSCSKSSLFCSLRICLSQFSVTGRLALTELAYKLISSSVSPSDMLFSGNQHLQWQFLFQGCVIWYKKISCDAFVGAECVVEAH